MKARSGLVLALSFLVGLMVMVPGSALAIVAGCMNTAGEESCVDQEIHPESSGAKIVGTVNIDYLATGTIGTCYDSIGTPQQGFYLAITMRVEKGSQLYRFQDMSFNVDGYSQPFCIADCKSTVYMINKFVNTVVAPLVYPTLYNNKKLLPTAVLKAGTKDVGTLLGDAVKPNTDPAFQWFMLDFEYAVQ